MKTNLNVIKSFYELHAFTSEATIVALFRTYSIYVYTFVSLEIRETVSTVKK